MSKPERGERTYTCRICGSRKGKSNRWLLAVTTKGTTGITFLAWSEEGPENETIQDLCGHECAAKALGRWSSEMI